MTLGRAGRELNTSGVELGLCKGSESPVFLWSLQWCAGLGNSTASQGQGKEAAPLLSRCAKQAK